MSLKTEPVITRTAVAAAVTAVADILSKLLHEQFATATLDSITTILFYAVSIAAFVVAAISARRKVTPTSNPVGNDGVPLVTSLVTDATVEDDPLVLGEQSEDAPAEDTADDAPGPDDQPADAK